MNIENKPELPAVFDDSVDEGSFDGFKGRRRDYDSDSDVDLVGLEDDDGGPAPGGTDDEEEEARWTDHLTISATSPSRTLQQHRALILTYLTFLIL